MLGATLMKGDAAGPYANWDVDGQGVLSLFDADAMASAVGSITTDGAPARDGVMFVCRVGTLIELQSY
jgi:phage tail sheath gpL-like